MFGNGTLKIIGQLVLLICASICLPAHAEFTTIAEAHEVSLSDFRAPVTQNGSAAFKPCASCASKSVAVTNETRYLINQRDVSLGEFREAIALITNRESALVVVLHHLEADTLLSIAVSY